MALLLLLLPNVNRFSALIVTFFTLTLMTFVAVAAGITARTAAAARLEVQSAKHRHYLILTLVMTFTPTFI